MPGSILGLWCKWVKMEGVWAHNGLGLEMNHVFFAHKWLPFCNWTGFVASLVQTINSSHNRCCTSTLSCRPAALKFEEHQSEASEWVKTRRFIMVSLLQEKVYQYNLKKGGETCVYLFRKLTSSLFHIMGWRAGCSQEIYSRWYFMAT